AFCAGKPSFYLAVARATIAGLEVAVITTLTWHQQVVTARRAFPLRTVRFQLAIRITTIEGKDIALVASFEPFEPTIATDGLDACTWTTLTSEPRFNLTSG